MPTNTPQQPSHRPITTDATPRRVIPSRIGHDVLSRLRLTSRYDPAHARAIRHERHLDNARRRRIARQAVSTGIDRVREAATSRAGAGLLALLSGAVLVPMGVTLALGDPSSPVDTAPAVSAPAPARSLAVTPNAAPTAEATPTAEGAPTSVPPAAPGPPKAPFPVKGTGEAAGPALMAEHRVRAGETLAAIGLRYQVPFELIAEHNQLANPNHIVVGRLLAIPVRPSDVAIVPRGGTLRSIAAAHGMSVAQLAALNPQVRGHRGLLAGGLLRLGPP